MKETKFKDCQLKTTVFFLFRALIADLKPSKKYKDKKPEREKERQRERKRDREKEKERQKEKQKDYHLKPLCSLSSKHS